jgi:hypothetical protein
VFGKEAALTMSTSFDHITPEQAELVRSSPVFFVASVADDLSKGPDGQGPVNLSPKGGSPLHVIGPNRVAYLDYTGSGNETSRDAPTGGPITLMVIVYGRRRCCHPEAIRVMPRSRPSKSRRLPS